MTADQWREALAAGRTVFLRNARTGTVIECVYGLSEKQTAVLLAGGLLNYITAA